MSALRAIETNQLIGELQINPKNTLIQHLQTEEGNLKDLCAFFIDEQGEIAGIPIQVRLENLSVFIEQFEKAYLVFRDTDNQLLFEVSDGLLCYISQDIKIRRCDVREVLYLCGMKNIS
ncbi:hypothetical protein [Viridibacillus arvi]|uniref:hypothetical protein n=1 Tax=Viridibacillus arvi TaxID=263475 RepID=UPI0034CD4DD8